MNTSPTASRSPRSSIIRLIVTLCVGVVIWFAPSPAGVTTPAWHLFAIFVATIVGIMLEPLPMGAVALCAIAAVTLTRTLALGDALAGFSNSVIWLVVMAFFSNLFSSMTHYGTGPAPVLFGAGYVSLADCWKLSAVVSVVNITIWLGVGSLWWKLLGLW